MKLSDVIQGFFLTKRRNLAKTTIANYEYAFRRLTAQIGGNTEFTLITKFDMIAYQESLEAAGLSPRSIHSNWSICCALWAWAEIELGVPHILRGVEKPRFQPPAIEPFSETELRNLLRAAEWGKCWKTRTGKLAQSKRSTAPRDKAMILVMLDTGVRVSELCGLLLNDYDSDLGRLHIRHGKRNKERFVFMGSKAQKAIWLYLMARNLAASTDPLFVTSGNRPMHRVNMLNMLRIIGKNAEVSNVHPHRFRHTFAINFLRNGGNIFELQRILGHEKLETVKVYLHLAQTDIAEAQRRASPVDNWRL